MPSRINEENYKNVFNESFVHIGVLENLNKNIRNFSEKLNKKIVIVPHKNITKKEKRPSIVSINAFSDKHPLLMKMYNFAVQLNS